MAGEAGVECTAGECRDGVAEAAQDIVQRQKSAPSEKDAPLLSGTQHFRRVTSSGHLAHSRAYLEFGHQAAWQMA